MEKKKIGIYTLNGNFNYGNRLQNYALLKKLEGYNLKCETIWFSNYKKKVKDVVKRILPFNKKLIRYNNFYDFTDKYLNVNYIKNEKDLNYDKYVVGSDQVWNYTFGTFNYNYFLSFSERKNNISYAASFGIDNITEEYKQLFAKGINNIGYISVREERGKEIIRELTGREDTFVLVDPTMLLDSKQWDEVAKIPKNIPEKYILNYFLGKLSLERQMEIERIAKENNCKIINILDENDPFYTCGPSEFLALEKNAFLICTDSFHSSVFAILYNRPFIIFDREDKLEKMNSRIDTLINKLELKNRKYNGTKITEENMKHDYTKAYQLLEIERDNSDRFLRNALGLD